MPWCRKNGSRFDSIELTLESGFRSFVIIFSSNWMCSILNFRGGKVQSFMVHPALSLNWAWDHLIEKFLRHVGYWELAPDQTKGSSLDCPSHTFHPWKCPQAIYGCSHWWWTRSTMPRSSSHPHFGTLEWQGKGSPRRRLGWLCTERCTLPSGSFTELWNARRSNFGRSALDVEEPEHQKN